MFTERFFFQFYATFYVDHETAPLLRPVYFRPSDAPIEIFLFTYSLRKQNGIYVTKPWATQDSNLWIFLFLKPFNIFEKLYGRVKSCRLPLKVLPKDKKNWELVYQPNLRCVYDTHSVTSGLIRAHRCQGYQRLYHLKGIFKPNNKHRMLSWNISKQPNLLIRKCVAYDSYSPYHYNFKCIFRAIWPVCRKNAPKLKQSRPLSSNLAVRPFFRDTVYFR